MHAPLTLCACREEIPQHSDQISLEESLEVEKLITMIQGPVKNQTPRRSQAGKCPDCSTCSGWARVDAVSDSALTARRASTLRILSRLRQKQPSSVPVIAHHALSRARSLAPVVAAVFVSVSVSVSLSPPPKNPTPIPTSTALSHTHTHTRTKVHGTK
eukprot:3931756-Rhodomonas_salina.4